MNLLKVDGRYYGPAMIRHMRDALERLPRINIQCETESEGIKGCTTLDVVRVEREDDGSFTAVTNHWPN